MKLSCGQKPLVKQVPSLLEAFSTSPTPSRFSFQKPLALKAWKRKMPQSCALEQTVGIPALPQALSNQSSTADQTTVNRQKPTTILLPLSTLCKHFEAATKIR
ncbi:5-oxoprolinase subunit [Trichinella pseudospiralis]